MSTDLLVWAYGVLEELVERAAARGDLALVHEYRARQKAIDHELGARQLTFQDEIENLRRSNALES